MTIPSTGSGNHLVVLEYNEGDSASAPTIAAAGVTFTNDAGQTAYDTHRTAEMWSADNIPSGVTTVTITLPVSTTGAACIEEDSGLLTVGAHDVSSSTFDQENSNFTTAAVTPTAAKNEVMYGWAFDASGPDHSAFWTASNSWTVFATQYESGGGAGSFAVFRKVVASTTGSYTLTGGNTASTVILTALPPSTYKAN